MSEVATLALSGVVGAVTGFLAALLKSALEERVKVDAALREVRTPLYKQVWRETRIVPLWPPNENLTYADLQQLSRRLRDWYFADGGIYLSRHSQRHYRRLQTLLAELARKQGPVTTGPRSDYERVQKACSALRTAMTDDLLSRRGRGAVFASLPRVPLLSLRRQSP